ncbi:MAG: carbohydrate ABC transporter permease [Clostridia bacterium]|nr:carbohydrate ABC transporter permease [Clostridia bacterium]
MNNKNAIKISKGEKAFNVFNICFMVVMMFIMFYPMWHVVCASFSNPRQLSAHTGLLLWPDGYSLAAYKLMMKNPMILKGYGNTLFILVFGLAINMFMTCLAAYVLSRRNVMLNKPITLIIVFTMYFSGGLIPTYLNIIELGLEDSLWAVIIPGAISTYNMIVLRTGFASVPESLEESAKIDGASNLRIMWQIILPLSKATVAVICLYYAVAHWNSWFNAMLYLTTRDKYPIQLILREILINNDTTSMVNAMDVGAGDSSFVSETVKYAVIIVSVVPILCVYPFIQKYFTKGVMVGAVKG